MGVKKEKSKKRSFSEWIIEKLCTFRWQSWAAYCVVLFAVGFIINAVTNFTFNFFTLHQVLLISATTMLVFAMKSFFNDMNLFVSGTRSSLLDKNPEVSSLFKKRLIPMQRNAWPFITSLIITVFFFTCIALLEYIRFDVIGIYALYIAGTSVLIGVYSYIQYLYFLWFTRRTSDCQFGSYDLYTPAQTPWVVQIAKISQRLRNYFLFIGLIYVIEYSILIPADRIEITRTSISLNMPNNIAFVVSWIALFILVIVAFPVINHIQRKFVEKLISKLKGKTISDVSSLMYAEPELTRDKKGQLTNVLTYSVIIENIRKSKSYPINRQVSYEAVMTIVTLLVHVMNLYDKITNVPQLSSLLP